jgi:hypothetical protein
MTIRKKYLKRCCLAESGTAKPNKVARDFNHCCSGFLNSCIEMFRQIVATAYDVATGLTLCYDNAGDIKNRLRRGIRCYESGADSKYGEQQPQSQFFLTFLRLLCVTPVLA